MKKDKSINENGILKLIGRGRRAYTIVLLLSIVPGCLMLLYSQTFIVGGIGATDYWWVTGTTPIYEPVVLNVTSESISANITIRGQRLVIFSFNTSDAVVSIEVVSSLNGTILNRSLVSGQDIEGVRFPPNDPTGWVPEQDYTVFVYWEGIDASVRFYYNIEVIMHADGVVYWTLPGYYPTQNLAFIILGIGVACSVLYVSVMEMRKSGSR